MNRSRLFIALLGVTVVVVAAAGLVGTIALRVASSEGDSTAGGGNDPLVQRSSGGGVDITATLATPDRLKAVDPTNSGRVDLGSEVAIILTVETHQGDLRSFDFEAASRLLPKGGPKATPLRWVLTKDDTHHLEGVLVFTREPGGQTTLAIRGLSGVAERLFNFPGQN